jgi:lipopolysaccharide biosynthesis glycosyltransferase
MINILYAGNYTIFDGILLSLLSILRYTKTPLHVYCLTMDFSELEARYIPINQEQGDYLRTVLRDVNPESQFDLIDVSKEYKETLGGGPNSKNMFTPYSQLRLLADLVPAIPDKILYLDTDIMANKDITPLYNKDISNYDLAGVKDVFYTRIFTFLIFEGSFKYINAGMLLLNMKKIREKKLLEKTRSYLNKRKLVFCDQAAINHTIKKKLILPKIYNWVTGYNKKIVVHHFCGVRKNFFFRVKPWHTPLVKEKTHAYDEVINDYLLRKIAFSPAIQTAIDPFKNPVLKINEKV